MGQTDSYKTFVSALRSHDKSLVVLVHSNDIENLYARYRKPWQRESMFRALKSGFNVKDIHNKERSHLSIDSSSGNSFLHCISSWHVGAQESKNGVQNHGYREKSLIRLGLDFCGKKFQQKRIEEELYTVHAIFRSAKFLPGSLMISENRKNSIP